jgi:hypothetical protein
VGSLVALGVVVLTLILISQTSWAVDGTSKKNHYDATNFGEPGDSMPDELADRPGHDQTNDRTPDNTVDAVYDGSPDCAANISGGGADTPRGNDSSPCINQFGDDIDSGDNTPENQTGDGGSNGQVLADGTSVQDGVPDATRYMQINRALEGYGDHGRSIFFARDYTPDWVNSDTYLARIGGPNSVGDEDPDGGRPIFGHGANSPTMRPHDFISDGDGNGGNPDNKRPKYGFGPGDKVADVSPDIGGLATKIGGGGGGGGCSLVAGRSVDPASGIAYLLVLLTPAAVIVVRRRLRRK